MPKMIADAIYFICSAWENSTIRFLATVDVVLK